MLFNAKFRKWVGVLCACVLMTVTGVNRLHAQATASIVGTVTDSSGAAMPGATVQVKNVGTGATQNATTDAAGRFRAPDLTIGNYEVQASNPGFQTVVHRGITLTVGSEPVVDFTLPVGQAQQTVTVESQVSQVETQSTAVGSLVETKQIVDLPLNGRNFTQLLTLNPGVTQIAAGAPGAGSTFYGNGTKYSIAGSRPSGQAYLLDDQDMTNFWNNGPGAGGLGTALGVEAIAEFQTLTNTYGAQYGGNGAVINASSRPGTNAYHGSAFEFLRNDKLEARNFFDGNSPPAFRRNQFGGSVGGPIKKDKIFFFANYEGYRSTQVVTNLITVPDECAHQFLTSTLTPGVCGAPVAQNGTPFATNPAVHQAIMNTMALWPNNAFNELAPGGVPSGTGNTFVLNPNIGKENYGLARIDYNISSKDSLFVRYIIDRADRDFTGSGGINVPGAVPYWPELDITRDHFVTAEWRRIISPTLVNSAHVGFTRTSESANVYGSPTVSNGAASPGTIASSGVHPLQFFGTAAGREDGNIQTFSGLTALGASTTLPFYLVPNKFMYGDDVIWTHGSHNVTFGATATRLRENTWAPFEVGGVWAFASLTNFEQGIASQVLSQLSDQQYPQADATKDYRYWVFTPYIEDQWKATNKLTVNIGLRYEPTTTINETRHVQLQLLNPPYGHTWTPEYTSSQDNPSLRNWDPRVGLAYDPFSDHKTSFRAGFGIFHNVIYSRDLNNWIQPPFLIATQVGAPYVGTCATSCSPITTPVAPGVIPTNGLVAPPNANYWYVKNTPYQFQWNFNVQREIAANTVVSAAYVGSHNVHMFTQLDFNYPIPCLGANQGCVYNGRPTFATNGVANPRPNPDWGSIVLANTIATSQYNGLQLSLNRRFSNHWQTQVSYTFSKSIDDSSGTYGLDGAGLANSGTNPTCLECDKGLSNFNRTHNIRVSGIYTVPFNAQGFTGQLVNGWQLTGVFQYLSGPPFSALSAVNRVFPAAVGNTGRPNVVPGCDLYANQTINQWFNPNCFALQAPGTFGNAGRDIVTAPGLWNLDNSLLKNWRVEKISESFLVEFRAEAFNILNHPSFGQPANNVFAGAAVNPSAGKITYTTSAPRQLQLALKLVF
jgi:hypothetical protein